MSARPDYYAVLGVPTAATSAEIKRRYRELAHKYHPDVNPHPEAVNRIKVINEAYHHLGDPDRRATYDAERVLFGKSAGAQPEPRRRPTASQAYGAAAAQPQSKMEFNGFGTVPGQGASAPDGHTGARSRPQSDRLASADRLVADARLAYLGRRMAEAERLCMQALRLDHRFSQAHELMGDILRRRGDVSGAVKAYSYAVQFDPSNRAAQQKLEQVPTRGSQARRSGAASGRTVTMPTPRQVMARETALAFGSLALTAALGALLAFFYYYPGDPTVGSASVNLIVTLLGSGLMVGILMAIYGGVNPQSRELTRPSADRGRVNLGLLLGGTALVSFYLSMAVYAGYALAQRQTSRSLIRAYGLTLLLTVLFGFLYQPPDAQVLPLATMAFAGNLLFPSVLVGWRIGDRMRMA